MPSFNPFGASHRNACTLFEIRLENDFIVFRGNEHEAAGQLLKGNLVLCLKEPLRVEDVHLRLQGNCRIAWIEAKQTPTGIHNQKVDKTTTILRHSWNPFVGGPQSHGQLLAAGNYEWPFELLLPGDTAESVEGLYQTNISYLLKATISRGKLAKNHHAYKRLRIIRTLDPTALEFNHAMSVENIWPNKIEYSVVIPQKALVFGSGVPLEMRFTPLLKGLDMGEITVKLLETQEFSVSGFGAASKSHKSERDVCTWTFEVNREENWNDNIEETGQDGWTVTKELPLPKKLTKCLQDCSVHGIKIRHKVKLTVALKNPDGHVSELRATLPVTIFISPNMPLDDEGNLISQDLAGTPTERTAADAENTNMAPPGYGMHVLDQLYDDVDPSGMMTPGMMTPGIQSGFASPFYSQSRAGSSENLAALANGAVTPAALSSRLQNVSLDPSHRNTSFTSVGSQPHSHSGTATPYLHPNDGDHTADSSQPHSTELSRQTSAEEHSGDVSGHSTPPEHVDNLDLEQLSKVPSYTTATRTPLPRTPSFTGSLALPDYNTALSAPTSPTRNPLHDPLATITEGSQIDPSESTATESGSRSHSRNNSSIRRNHSSLGFNFLHRSTPGDSHGERQLRMTQQRNAH
ncbi:putative Arrestin C-terminal-like domain-containing protein [Seiridium cardinale]|uniref:Arrestin C-terminal-like domain-containing protein n=1 Tax=Seiridium cardinale TaxID=138064 RepID=A0ABR2Y1P1_9PEZI